MSETDRPAPRPSAAEPREESAAPEPFLRRWSRLKADSAARRADADVPAPLPEETVDPASAAAEGAGEGEPLPPGDEDMPPIESLNADSDFSGFMSPRVSAALRQQALRKLFRSPRFNVISQLDDYIDDYRNYPLLGDIVTSDMKHAAARLLEKQLKKAEAVDAVAAAGAEETRRAAAETDSHAVSSAEAEADADAAPSDETMTTDAETNEPDDTEEPARDA